MPHREPIPNANEEPLIEKYNHKNGQLTELYFCRYSFGSMF